MVFACVNDRGAESGTVTNSPEALLICKPLSSLPVIQLPEFNVPLLLLLDESVTVTPSVSLKWAKKEVFTSLE